MAEMTRRALVALAFVLWAVNGFAQSPVPAAGLAAEGTGDWPKALEVYRIALDRHPNDAPLWARVADIEARLGNVKGSAAALEHAVQAAPNDAELHSRLSQTYAVLDRPSAALDAIERALALSPDSVTFLRARAILATWAGQYNRAQDSYRRLAKLQPDDQDISLNLARVSAWGGRTDAAVEAYRRYLRAKPDAAAAWIELARAETWRGNYGAALGALETYQRRFGRDDKYAREMTAVLARAGRPREALDMLEPMLRAHPDDYELNLTRAIALTTERRARDASDALETVRRLQPQSSDTRSVERVVRETLASTADPGVSIYSDSSSLEVQRVEPRVTVSLANGTTIAGGFEHERLWARKGSRLEQIDGTETAQHDQIWISAARRIGEVNLRGRVGQARTSADDLTAYLVGADFTPLDGVKFSVERSSGFFVVSPRTVGLGMRQVSHSARLEWSPGARTAIAIDGRYQTLSDGNRRWEFTFSPRYSVARTDRVNLDLGVMVAHLSTKTNFENGYYDPSHYQYYAFTAYPYWKLRESIGLGMSLGLGAQRDDFSPAFRLGGNATAEATIGIYRPWALKLWGGGTFNQRLGSGAFGGYSAGVSLIRRF